MGAGVGIGVGAGAGVATGALAGVGVLLAVGKIGALAHAASRVQSKTGLSLRGNTIWANSCKRASLGQNPFARQLF
jgi:hypothetical protein